MVDRVQTAGDLSLRSSINSHDEIGTIAQALNNFLGSLRKRAGVVEKVADGDLSADVELISDKDSLGRSLTVMLSSLRQAARQADGISTGNYDSSINPRSEKDTLGIAMQRMTHTLRENSERSALQDWQKNGQNQLYDRIRGVLDESELADRIKTAAEMGDVIQIKSIVEELKSESDAAAPFCDELIRLPALF
jgi:methyl-accepting chemotaxis protein